jgi:hypothetical protein
MPVLARNRTGLRLGLRGVSATGYLLPTQVLLCLVGQVDNYQFTVSVE